MAAFTPLSAKFAQVRFGSSVITAKKWTVTPTADMLDITNFEGNGFADWIAGIYQADFTVEGDWDSANDQFANPFSFVIGTIVTGVKLYTNTIASAFWSFPTAIISETPMTAAVRETITFVITMKAKGSFTYP